MSWTLSCTHLHTVQRNIRNWLHSIPLMLTTTATVAIGCKLCFSLLWKQILFHWYRPLAVDVCIPRCISFKSERATLPHFSVYIPLKTEWTIPAPFSCSIVLNSDLSTLACCAHVIRLISAGDYAEEVIDYDKAPPDVAPYSANPNHIVTEAPRNFSVR